jgi:sugar (pentulose or hexulose) kinase
LHHDARVITLGIDLGTTTITCLAMEPATAAIVAVATVANDAEITLPSDKNRGRSEWNPDRIVERSCQCLRHVANQLGDRAKDIVAIGITGQQHGVVVVDRKGRPLVPLVNWQDRRGDDPFPGTSRTYVEQATWLAGADAANRTGCHLATGFLGVTLFWLQCSGVLPSSGLACFIGDYLASELTGRMPVSDPTHAASSGLFDVRRRCWDGEMLESLQLPASIFPEIREADQRVGPLTDAVAASTGIPAGIPVFVPIGDSQAAFLGSVDDCEHDVLVNVGTGAQVVAAVDRFLYAPPLETRPLPLCGNLLVGAQPCGGRAYAVLEGFFRDTVQQFGGKVDSDDEVYETMNRLAGSATSDVDSMLCNPLFAGTRAHPQSRASWSNISAENFTPAHMIRALLEGIAEALHNDCLLICREAGRSCRRVIGSGNALRKNPVLREIVARRFAMPLELPPHREEAAVGAARMAAIGIATMDSPPPSNASERGPFFGLRQTFDRGS